MEGIIYKRDFLDIKKARDKIVNAGSISRNDIEFMENMLGKKVVSSVLPLNMFTSNPTRVGLEEAVTLLDKEILDIKNNNIVDKDLLVRTEASAHTAIEEFICLLDKLKCSLDSKFAKEYKEYLLPDKFRYGILNNVVPTPEETVVNNENEDDVVTDVNLEDNYKANVYSFLFKTLTCNIAYINHIAAYSDKSPSMISDLTSLKDSLTDTEESKPLPLLSALLAGNFGSDKFYCASEGSDVTPLLEEITDIHMSSELLEYENVISKLSTMDIDTIINNLNDLKKYLIDVIEKHVLGKGEETNNVLDTAIFETLYSSLVKIIHLLQDKDSIDVIKGLIIVFACSDCCPNAGE